MIIINILLAVVIIYFAVRQYKKYDGKPTRYIIGSLAMLLGILFIEPTPDPISFGLYCVSHGLTYSAMNASTISSVIWSYEVWSIAIGLALVAVGMILLKLNFKRLWKKLNFDKYWLAFLLAIMVVIFVAYMDISGMFFWNSFSTTGAYINGLQGIAFWNFFKSIVLLTFLILPIAYFFLYRRDFSEAIALFLSEVILWMFGFADMMFFVLQKQVLPATMSWLNAHPIIGGISSTLGYADVNPMSLLFSVTVGFILAYFSAKLLRDKF